VNESDPSAKLGFRALRGASRRVDRPPDLRGG
jgi:hypothetical protein